MFVWHEALNKKRNGCLHHFVDGGTQDVVVVNLGIGQAVLQRRVLVHLFRDLK